MRAYHLDRRVLVDAELVLKVYRGRREKDVQTGMRRVFHRFPPFVDVLLAAAAERGYRGVFYDGGDLFHRLEFSLAGGGEACFDDVRSEAFERLRDVEFFVDVHAAAWRLFAVAQRRVEDPYLSFLIDFFLIYVHNLYFISSFSMY